MLLIAKLRRKLHYPTYASMPVGLQFFLFIGTGLGALYIGTITSHVALPLLEATNHTGLTLPEFVLWVYIGLLGLLALYYGAIARRCGGLMYDRYFQ